MVAKQQAKSNDPSVPAADELDGSSGRRLELTGFVKAEERRLNPPDGLPGCEACCGFGDIKVMGDTVTCPDCGGDGIAQ